MDIVTKLTVTPKLESPKIAFVVTSLIAVFILYSLARITWSLLTPDVALEPWRSPQVSASGQAQQRIDFSNYHWFGRAGAPIVIEKSKQPVSDAPKTRLKLVLTGVVANENPKLSMAIIEYQSQQDTYVIDQKISSTRASIVEIYSDRVILSNSGKHETLMLDGFDYTKTKNTNSLNTKPSNASNKRAAKLAGPKRNSDLANTRRDIIANPNKILDHISITPVNIKGELQGYRLNAGRDPKLFHESGLKPNDLAVAINGYDLTDISQSMSVMAELKTMNNIMISVERDGQLIDIQFALKE